MQETVCASRLPQFLVYAVARVHRAGKFAPLFLIVRPAFCSPGRGGDSNPRITWEDMTKPD